MKILFNTLLLMFCSVFAEAQNYQTVNSGRTVLFKTVDGYIHGLRIDSLEFDQDSILYPMRTFQPSGNYDCLSPTKASWIGDRVILKENGDNLFFDWQGDTILIKTQARESDSWVMFQNNHLASNLWEGYGKITCTLVKKDTMTILGVLDSVKTMALQFFDQNLQPIIDKKAINIGLSKSFGFVKLIPFNLISTAELSLDIREFTFEEYELAGLSQPNMGLQNLKWFSAHDFQENDEIHTVDKSGMYLGPYSFDQHLRKTTRKYLSKEVFSDSIIYMVERQVSLERTDEFLFRHDTIQEVIRQNPNFDKLPGEVIYEDEYQATSYAMHQKDGTHKFKAFYGGYLNNDENGCWRLPIADGCFPALRYTEGLGGPYYACEGMFSYESRELIYYKKGNISWGTPMVLTSIQEETVDLKLKIQPNPATDQFIITGLKTGFPYSLELINLQGKVVLKTLILNEQKAINIHTFPSGIYIYHVQNKHQQSGYGKLVIE